MKLIPLQDRVLIKPHQAPQQTASGLHLAEHWKPEQTGTVVGVGRVKHPRKEEAFKLAEKIEGVCVCEHLLTDDERTAEDRICVDTAQLLRDLTGREPLVHPGDSVIFSWIAGNEIWINDGEERYLLMREDDILAVVDYDREQHG